ncbi:MAG: DNA cytosine methyltransferase [Velocimicrobium sp.]
MKILEPTILTPKRTEYGKEVRIAYESGKLNESRHNMTELQPRNDGVSNTLTTVQKDNLLLEPTVKIKQATVDGYIECKIGGVADLSFPSSTTRRGRVQDNGDTCPTITATETGVCKIESRYRIRKLIPRECGRLMSVTDENITKMELVNSNSQLYKEFGNSIVVACMVAMYSNLNIQRLPNWDGIKNRY